MNIQQNTYNALSELLLKRCRKSGFISSKGLKSEDIRFGDDNGNKFTSGFASRNITPLDLGSHTYWMAGYHIGKKVEGLLDPLTVNALWLDCGDGQGIVFLSCDIVGLTGYDIDEFRSSMKDFCDISGCRHISVSCTHTHAGVDTMGYWGPLPISGKDKKYMAFLFSRMKEACYEAYKNRTSGELYFGSINAEGLNDRWRQPYFTKPILNRFRFVPDNGDTETWFLNFPAHPNTLGNPNKKISADYPCYMRREINRHKNVNILFAVSAIGATDIGRVSDNNVERTIIGGAKLGTKALEINNDKKLENKIRLISKHFIMPIDNIVLSIANSLGIFTSKKCKAVSNTGCGFISEINYISIGGIEILTMPGEMFPELVWNGGYCGAEASATGDGAEINPETLASIFKNDDILIFGVTNDMAGYALAENDFVLHDTMPFVSRGTDRFGRNHYHETNSCGIKTGKVISQVCREIKQCIDNKESEVIK